MVKKRYYHGVQEYVDSIYDKLYPREKAAVDARGRYDRVQDLTTIATQAVAGLQAAGVNVDIVIK